MTVSFLEMTTATAKTNDRDLEDIRFKPVRLPRSESQATGLHRWVKGAATFESIRMGRLLSGSPKRANWTIVQDQT
jgi:hypothetical protein